MARPRVGRPLTINTSGNQQFYYRHITREYEPYMDNQAEPPVQITGNTLGRPVKIQVGVSGDVARDYETEFFYEAATGRLQRIIEAGTTFGARIRV